jgi:hypothetical protein
VSSDLRALGGCGHESLLPKVPEKAHVFAVGGGGSGVTQRVGGQFDPVADGNDVVGIERSVDQSLSVKVAQRFEDGIEDFACLLPIERRAAERGGECIVGRFEDCVADGFAPVLGATAIEQFDQIRVTKLAGSMPEIESRSAIGGRFGHQLYDRATAIRTRRRLKERGLVIAA